MEQISDSTDYKIVRMIGEGGMGAVYEALLQGSEGFKKRVALKTILERLTEDKDFVDMFIGEAKLVADLVHENIVQIYQLGHVGNLYYIAMEFINGVNLEEFVQRHNELGRPLPPEWSAFVVSRVARGLEYAHGKCGPDGRPLGVVHRDVNPKNVMLRIDGVVKLGDFGIAKAATFMADREGEALMGKCMYMSPEQASYQKTDGRSDIFSLGIVLYELLTGKPLFTGEDFDAVRENALHGEIPPPREINRDVPEDLEKILMMMLERDLEKRYSDSTALSYDLEYYLYHKGYGPTNQKLGKYLFELFPEIHTEHGMAQSVDTTETVTPIDPDQQTVAIRKKD